MAKTNPFEFLQQVRNEGSKVTWPTRREVLITTIMVFIVSSAAAVYFLLTDYIIRFVLSLILDIVR